MTTKRCSAIWLLLGALLVQSCDKEQEVSGTDVRELVQVSQIDVEVLSKQAVALSVKVTNVSETVLCTNAPVTFLSFAMDGRLVATGFPLRDDLPTEVDRKEVMVIWPGGSWVASTDFIPSRVDVDNLRVMEGSIELEELARRKMQAILDDGRYYFEAGVLVGACNPGGVSAESENLIARATLGDVHPLSDRVQITVGPTKIYNIQE